MTFDPHRGLSIAYNILDLPRKITAGAEGNIEIIYDATGKKRLHRVNGGVTRRYAGALVFVKEEGGDHYLLEAATTGDGRIVFTNENRVNELYAEYHHKDHLGNVRVAFTDRNMDKFVEIIGGANEVTQINDFYPFGLQQEGNGAFGELGSSSNRYRYNGMELNEELGLYDYGARWHDQAIGRWGQIDPLAADYGPFSPYNYVLNNPLIFIDPDVRDVYFTGSDGTIHHFETEDDTEDFFFLQNQDGETAFLGGFAKNDNGLIQLPSEYSFSSKERFIFGDGPNSRIATEFGFSVKSGNKDRAYISGEGLAAMFGALAETNTQDLTVVGFSSSDGSSPSPSKSHKDGKNGDFRYLRKDFSGGAVLLQDQQMDISRQNTLNQSLNKFGWKSMLSENFTPHGKKNQTRLDHTTHYNKSRHHNHLHLQGFRPRIRKKRKDMWKSMSRVLIWFFFLAFLNACSKANGPRHDLDVPQDGAVVLTVTTEDPQEVSFSGQNLTGFLRIKTDLLADKNVNLEVLNPDNSMFGEFVGTQTEPKFVGADIFEIKEYYPGYFIVILNSGAINEQGNYPVEINGEIKYIRHLEGVTVFEDMAQHVMNSFIGLRKESVLREAPEIGSNLIDASFDRSTVFFDVQKVEGDWAFIICNAICEGCPSDNQSLSGWVKYVDDSDIIIDLFYVC